MQGIYKDVMGYPNYQVSTLGNIRNKKTGRVLRHLILTKGYHGVRLYNNGNGKTLKVHRLVAIHWITNPDKLPEVNHKLGDKELNGVGDLEWCTGQQNHEHKMQHGLNKAPEKFGQMTLLKVMHLRALGYSTRDIAHMTGVSKSHVHTLIKLS